MRPYDGSQKAYCQAVGTTSTNYPHLDVRDPSATDVHYPVGKQWQNTTNNSLWYLNNFTSTGGVLQAVWTQISNSSTSVLEVVTDSGSASPAAGILNLLGEDGITFSGSGNTVQLNNDLQFSGNTGTANFVAGNFNITASNGLSVAAAGSTAALSNNLQFTGNTGTSNFASGNLNIVGAAGVTVSMTGSTATINGFSNVQTSTANSNNYNFTWTAPNIARMYAVQIGIFSSGIGGALTYAIATMYLQVTSLFGFPQTVGLTPLTIISQHNNSNGYSIVITPTAAVNNQISFNVTNANGFTITVTSVELGTYNTS